MTHQERDLLLEKLKEEVIDSHARENEIVALLSVERKRAAEEQIRLHAACRAAEAEKHSIIMQADAEISQSLRQQLAVVSAAPQRANITNRAELAASMSLSQSIELPSVSQTAGHLPGTSSSSTALLFNSSDGGFPAGLSASADGGIPAYERHQEKLAEILPEDLLRNSNEELLLNQAMARVRRASMRDTDASVRDIQSELANEIKARL